jgi:hypothetical protein
MSTGLSTRLILRAGCVALLAGCAQKGPPALYMWGSFPRQQYEALSSAGAGSAAQIDALEAQAEKARAAGAALPPGFRAHLGMLKLSVGDSEQARRLWQAEKAAFPESSPYIDRLLERLEAPPKKERPA